MPDIKKHSDYSRIVERAEFLLSSWKGGLQALNSKKYIFKYPPETDVAYNVRKERAVVYNYFRPIISFFTNAIYKEFPQRPVAEKHEYFRWFIESANQRKESLNKVMKKISLLSTFLKVGVLVDAENLSDDEGLGIPLQVTRDQKKENRLFPYITILKPENIIDWHYDKNGLAWVKLKDVYVEKDNPIADYKEKTRYLLYTREYFRKGKKADFVDKSIATSDIKSYPDGVDWGPVTPHSLGEVPIKFIFQHDIDEDDEWESSVEEVAMGQRRIANWMSNIDENIWSTCHSSIAVPFGDHWEVVKKNLETESSGKKIIPYEAGSQPPTFIRDNVINIPQILSSIQLEITQIYSTVGITSQNKENFMGQSGTSKEYDFYQFNSILENKAQSLQEMEEWIFRIFAKYETIPLDEDEELVKYPSDFKVIEDLEKMQHDLDVATARISKSLSEYASKEYVKHAYPELPENEPKLYKQIQAEIKEKYEKMPFEEMPVEDKEKTDSGQE